jgi:hypothetical protein
MKHKTLDSFPTPKPFGLPAFWRKLLWGAVAVGFIPVVASLMTDSHRFWSNYLLNYFFWMSLILSGVFFTALQHITGASWSVPVRRIPEAIGGLLPLVIVLFLFLFFGLHELYEWTHADVVAADPILKGKSAYLNVSFFSFRNLIFLFAWTCAAFLFLKYSTKQDQTGSASLSKKSVKLSAAFLIFFALSYTFTSFDLMMSLEPHWFSTIFGVYCFSGLFLSGLALITIIVILMRRQGALPVVNEFHLQDLGKLLLAFCIFWAYIAFSQFMLIWYGNLPEETFYIITRVNGEWQPLSILLLMVKFIVPFILLLPAIPKRNETYLLIVSVLILIGQWIDCYWMIFPVYSKSHPVFGWQEIGLMLGFLALFALAIEKILKQFKPYPQKDPKLLEGVNFHQ